MALDFFGLLALILGILYTVRKLDVRQREPSEFPNVPAFDFERWKSKQLAAYNLGSGACFLKVAVDLGLYIAQRAIGWTAVRILGASIFFVWVFGLVGALLLSRAARKLSDELGITLTARRPEPR